MDPTLQMKEEPFKKTRGPREQQQRPHFCEIGAHVRVILTFCLIQSLSGADNRPVI